MLAVELAAAEGDDAATGALVLPSGLRLDSAAHLAKRERPLKPLQFSACLPAGRLVPLALDAATVTALEAGTALAVTMTANDSGWHLAFSSSLSDFASALHRIAQVSNSPGFPRPKPRPGRRDTARCGNRLRGCSWSREGLAVNEVTSAWQLRSAEWPPPTACHVFAAARLCGGWGRRTPARLVPSRRTAGRLRAAPSARFEVTIRPASPVSGSCSRFPAKAPAPLAHPVSPTGRGSGRRFALRLNLNPL